MLFQQFYLESLGHASYFIGSEHSGEALLVDARRDVDIYFDEARKQGMRIRYAVDTHQHNDYVSGICELASRSGAETLAGADAKLGYPARRLADGEKITMGEVVVEAIHTPGHTPEHMSLLLTDLSRGDVPVMLLSGGLLLVGDVARPDLYGGAERTVANARDLFHSLHDKIMRLPDYVEVCPTHVAGSLCGGNISSRLTTTIGYERELNAWLQYKDIDEFVAACVRRENLPSVPPYWNHMRKINQDGPRLLGALAEPPALGVDEFDRLRNGGMHILDCRSPEAFAAHIPGAFHAGWGSSFTTWAGTVLPFGTPYMLVLQRAQDLWDVCRSLLRIGYGLPNGWLSGGMHEWRSAGKDIEIIPQWSVKNLNDEIKRQEDLFVLDVRQPREWAAGHIESAVHVSGAEVSDRINEIPRDRPVAVICGSGYRSSAITSILKNKGYEQVHNVLGGMSAWKKSGFSTIR
ncbi:MAG TPA: rhodanese-like domain-containing protein [Dissulfurispiraceae bacterium]|nr:rhodanese-like domain-containing protein [Dissulfurispiraceae bacterium]